MAPGEQPWVTALSARLRSREVQRSEITAAFREGPLEVLDADVVGGNYSGKVSAITADCIVQHVHMATGRYVVHDRLLCDTSDRARTWLVGDSVSIVYAPQAAPEITSP